MKPVNIVRLVAVVFIVSLSAWFLHCSLVFERPAPGTSKFVFYVVLPTIYLVGSSGLILEALGAKGDSPSWKG